LPYEINVLKHIGSQIRHGSDFRYHEPLNDKMLHRINDDVDFKYCSFVSYYSNLTFEILPSSLQEEERRSQGSGRHHPDQLGIAEASRCTLGFHLPDLPEDQVCRWLGAHLQLLQCALLCPMWGQGHPQI